jgi:predicted MFS family arabinose efflux permease
MLAFAAVAATALVLLVLWERRHHDPVLPLHLLRMPAIARSDAVVMCFAAALFSTILYLPLYLQLGRGVGIGASGLLLLPVTLAQVVSSAVVGRLVTQTGHVRVFPLAGLTLATAAFLGLAIAVAGAPTAVVTGLTMLVGVGLGMVMPPTQVAVQAAAGRAALGVATATISLSRAVGGAIGVAVLGAVLFAQMDRNASGAGALLRRAMEGGAAYVAAMPTVQRAELAAGVDDAYRIVFIVIAAITAVGAAIAASVPRTDWDEEPAEPPAGEP